MIIYNLYSFKTYNAYTSDRPDLLPYFLAPRRMFLKSSQLQCIDPIRSFPRIPVMVIRTNISKS